MGEITKTDDEIVSECIDAIFPNKEKQAEPTQEIKVRKKPGRKPKRNDITTDPLDIPDAVRNQLIKDLSSIDCNIQELETSIKQMTQSYHDLVNRRYEIQSFLDAHS